MQIRQHTLNLIQADRLRMDCLAILHELALPQAMICAGFIRNLIWDTAHDQPQSTALNDVDVAWFSSSQLDPHIDFELEYQLQQRLPQVNWQVRNQARMHNRNAVAAYTSAKDAVERFPEIATCLAVAMNDAAEVTWCVSSGLADAWALRVRHNPHSGLSSSIARQRIRDKKWQVHWPNLQILI